jgi:hypothetical protein
MRVHPHMFRHAFSHNWLDEGGTEGELVALNGWKSRRMLGRGHANAHDHGPAADRPSGSEAPLTGAWWDATSRAATTVATHADDITQQALSLVVEEVLRRIGPPDRAAALVGDALAGRPGPSTDTAQATDQAATRPSGTTDENIAKPSWRRRRTGFLLDEAFALRVLTAPLVVAGWFQAHAVHTLLDGLPWPLAIGFTTAWEGAAAYCARLYLRALLRGRLHDRAARRHDRLRRGVRRVAVAGASPARPTAVAGRRRRRPDRMRPAGASTWLPRAGERVRSGA